MAIKVILKSLYLAHRRFTLRLVKVFGKNLIFIYRYINPVPCVLIKKHQTQADIKPLGFVSLKTDVN